MPGADCPYMICDSDCPCRAARVSQPSAWTFHTSPYRHYRLDGSWNAASGERIVSVTQILDGGQNRLTSWAAAQAVAAGERVAEDWCGLSPSSALSFPALCELTGQMPDQVRDRAATRGTDAHHYLAWVLGGQEGPQPPCEYALRCAIETFLVATAAVAVRDGAGARVERVVGDADRGVAGTYDGQADLLDTPHPCGSRHRLDAKSSKSLQGKHFAQLAAYERMAALCGEEPSDYLTILHLRPSGDYRLVSIAVGSPEHTLALAMFDAALVAYRAGPKLDKLVRPC